MACFVPFNNRNLDISLFVFRPTVVIVDELVDALKHFSSCTETLGCVQNAILRSIHGSMILWYGAWLKRSDESKKSLEGTLLSMLSGVLEMSILFDHCFFEAYAGESRDSSPAANFCSGDTVSINSAIFSIDEVNEKDFSYACLTIFKDRFPKMDGAISGVCFRCQTKPRVLSLFVWRSLHHCYSFILKNDFRKAVMPYVEGHSLDLKYDIFRVVFVNGDNALTFHFYPPHRMLENQVENKGASFLL